MPACPGIALWTLCYCNHIHVPLPFLFRFLCFAFFRTKCPIRRPCSSRFNQILIKILSFLDHQVSIELDSTLRRDSRRRVRNRWHLLFTLHNNSSLQEHRRQDMFTQKSPFAAFQVMIQKGIVQYNQCEAENDDESGVQDVKLWLAFKPQFKLQTTSVHTDAKWCFDNSHRQCRHHFRPGGTLFPQLPRF